MNLLRNSRVNPKLSAHAYLFGNFDFNKSPLLPPGTKIIVHAKPGKRTSWAFHGEQGWYISPGIHHYRCIKVYIPKTHKERIADTIQIIPKNIHIPQANVEDHLRNRTNEIVELLKAKRANILMPSTSEQALIQIAKLLQQDDTPETNIAEKQEDATKMRNK